jgi:hypothetical protein
MTSDPVSLRLLVDTIPAPVWSNLADAPTSARTEVAGLHGIRSEGARGWGWQAAVHPDDPRNDNS